MTYVRDLREAARAMPLGDARFMLQGAADTLQVAIDEFYRNPTEDTMVMLNGAWAYAARVKRMMQEPNGRGPAGGAMPVPQAMAA